MVKLIQTNTHSSSVSIYTKNRPRHVIAAPSSAEYESRAVVVLDATAPSEVRLSEIRVPVSQDHVPEAINVHYYSEANKNPIPATRIPDFWTRDVMPLVSQRAKDLIEEHDSGIHQFFPVALHPHGADEPFDHTQFYFFANCRIIRVEPHETSVRGKRWIDCRSPETQLYEFSQETLRRRRDLCDYLERFPIWKLETGRRLQFASEAFVAAGQKAKLNGFQASDKRVKRHVREI